MTLSNRLETLLDLVPRCSLAADIGADHALLTLELLRRGTAERVLCTDLSEPSLNKAKTAVAERGEDARVIFCLGDGLSAIHGYSPEAIVIAGMGGETIADILKAHPPREGVRYLLQPMSRASHLRRFLSENGYAVTEERLAKDAGRIYPVLSVVFDPETAKTAQKIDFVCGKANLPAAENDPLVKEYFTTILRAFVRRKNGRKKAGIETSEEDAIIAELRALLRLSD